MSATNTPNSNPALVLSGILQQLGALSLLAGLYKLAFPTQKAKNDTKTTPVSTKASTYFLNTFKLFTAAQMINKANQAFNIPASSAQAFSNPTIPASSAPSKPKGP